MLRTYIWRPTATDPVRHTAEIRFQPNGQPRRIQIYRNNKLIADGYLNENLTKIQSLYGDVIQEIPGPHA